MNKRIVLSLLVFAAAVLPFAGTLRHGIVNIDDYGYVKDYPEVTRGLSIDGLKWAGTFVGEGIWMPLTWASYQADFSVGSLMGWDRHRVYNWMHGVNVTVHGVNAVLVFLLLSMLFGVRGALVGALVWAVHPLRVESIAWVSARKDVLSMTFLLLALIGWTGFRHREHDGEGKWAGWYAGALAAFLLGAGCKPSVMVFPGLCFVLDWFFLGALKRETKWEVYVLPVTIAAALALFAQDAQAAGGATVVTQTVPLSWKLLNAAVSYGVYLVHFVWPFDLAVQCTIRHPGWPRLAAIALPVAVLVAVPTVRALQDAVWSWGDGRKRPLLGASVWFGGALIPFLGISGFGYHAFADRFTYIPAVGLSLAVAWAVERMVLFGWKRACFAVFSLALIGGLGLRTWDQCRYWKDDKTLWERTWAVDGERNMCAVSGMLAYYFDREHFNPEIRLWADRALASGDVGVLSGVADIVTWVLCRERRFEEADDFLMRTSRWMNEQARKKLADEVAEGVKPQFVQLAYSRITYGLSAPGQMDIAEMELDNLDLKCPNNRGYLLLRGEYWMKKGYPERAKAAWRKLLSDEAEIAKGEYYDYDFVNELIAGRKDEWSTR